MVRIRFDYTAVFTSLDLNHLDRRFADDFRDARCHTHQSRREEGHDECGSAEANWGGHQKTLGGVQGEEGGQRKMTATGRSWCQNSGPGVADFE